MDVRSSITRRLELSLPFLIRTLARWHPITRYRKWVLVTTAADVREVLNSDDRFAVVYEPRMRTVTGGENFFLGMADSPDYQTDVQNWRAIFDPTSVATVIGPLVRSASAEAVASASHDGCNLVEVLTSQVPYVVAEQYMGICGIPRAELVDLCTALFDYLFAPGTVDKRTAEITTKAERLRTHIDAAIAERRASSAPPDDAITRALARQHDGAPRLSDVDIRNNLLGIVVGAVPTTSKAAAVVVDYLLDHQTLLNAAATAAQNEDWDLLHGYVEESLRFHPFAPVILRRAVHDTDIAATTKHRTTIKQGTTVAVATIGAMWDPAIVTDRSKFDPTRPNTLYMSFGCGLHECFGAQINRLQIAAIVGAAVARPGLRRAGPLRYRGSYPYSLQVRWD